MINQKNMPQDAEAEDTEADHHDCCNDSSEGEDDPVKECPGSPTDVTGKSRAAVNDVEVLDDDIQCGKTKKTSYPRTQIISGFSETDHHSCSTDFSEDEAELKDELHKTTSSRIQMSEFELSDDEDISRGAFLKSPKIHGLLEADLFSHSNDDEDDSVRERPTSTTNKTDALKAGRSRGRTKDSFLKTQNMCSPSNGDHQSLSDYFNEVEEDYVNEAPKSTKNMTDVLEARESRATVKDVELSFDQRKCEKAKKVSSLESQRISSPSELDHHPGSSDFSEAEDAFLDELSESIKHGADAFKAMKSKIRMNTFVLSDDDDTKKDSFLKAPNICSPSEVDHYSGSDEEDDSEKKLPKSTKNKTGAFKSRKLRARINYVELSDEEGKKGDSFLNSTEIHSVSEASHYSHSDEDGTHSVEEFSKSAVNAADVLMGRKSRARIKDFELSDDDCTKADNLSCSEDDCVTELLKSRISKVEAFKSGKSRAKNKPVSEINKAHLSVYQSCDDVLFGDEETQKHTFQNKHKIHRPSEADICSHSDEDEYVLSKSKKRADAFTARTSRARSKDGELLGEVPFLETQRSRSPFERSSQNVIPDSSNGGHNNIKTRHLSRLDFKLVPLADAAAERDLPSPRRETPSKNNQVGETLLEEAITQDLDRSHAPSASPVRSLRSCSPKYPTSFEEFNKDLGNRSVHCVAQFSHNREKTSHTRISSSHPEIDKIQTSKNQSVKSKCTRTCSIKIESKYMGTLKLLDQKGEKDPLTVNLLRAAVYHRWLKMKNDKSRESMQTKKEEEEIKKKTEQAKKEAAVASYEAWEKKKASLKAEAKQKQVVMRKEQQESSKRKNEKRQSAKNEFDKWKKEHDHLLKERYRREKEAENDLKLKIDEEKFEKTQSAKKAFEKWKKEHDHLRKEKYIKEKEVENTLTLRKQRECMERKRNNESVFRDWCEKKQAMLKCKDIQIKKAEEERMREKEERDRKALEAYEDWLARKELKQRREDKLKTANFYH